MHGIFSVGAVLAHKASLTQEEVEHTEEEPGLEVNTYSNVAALLLDRGAPPEDVRRFVFLLQRERGR